MPDDKQQTDTKPSLRQLVMSMLAAFGGVQNQENHDRDNDYLEQAGFMPYIIIGVVMTILFVLLVYGAVQLILSQASG